MIFHTPDIKLASLVERLEASAWTDLAEAFGRQNTASEITIERDGGGVSLMCKTFDLAWVNRTMALGLEHPLTPSALDSIESRYERCEIPRWVLQWCPLAAPPNGDVLFTSRGARRMNAMIRWWRTIETDIAYEDRFAFRVEEIARENRTTFASVLSRATETREPAAATMVSETIGVSRWRFYAAFDGEEPIACAAMFVDGKGAWLGLAATLPGHRRKGLQTQLIRRRLSDAAKLGCTWATAEGSPNPATNPIGRTDNLMRAGFIALYYRPNYLFTTGR